MQALRCNAAEREALIKFLSNDEKVKVFCNEPLPAEYSYASLSTMLLDAIFSIGVRYGQVRKVVAEHARSQQYDSLASGVADPYPLAKLIAEGRTNTFEQFAHRLGNRGRTSTRSGTLKAQAVVLAAEALVQHGIVDLASWHSADDATLLATENEFRKIKGQKSGVSWDYLSMLAGDESRVKADRMVLRYVETALGRRGLSPREAGALLTETASAIRGMHDYPSDLTARKLDWAVWNVGRKLEPPRASPNTHARKTRRKICTVSL
jgi:hypothetical protein